MIRASPTSLVGRAPLRASFEPAVRGASRIASIGRGSSVGGVSDVMMSGGGLFYSPTLSTDFYELPRSSKEERLWYRWFCDHDPLVGRCIDLHSTLPLSKVMLTIPHSKDHEKAKRIHNFFTKMWEEISGWEMLLEVSYHWWMYGEAFPFLEYDKERKVWSRVTVLDGGNVEIEPVPFSANSSMYLVPDSMEISQYKESYRSGKYDLSDDARKLLEILETEGRLTLDTDPLSGSHVHHLKNRRSSDGSRGISILKRCLTTLLYRDKLRQAQTQISSRNMTPKHIVWGEGLNPQQVEALRDQVDMALNENDFTIVANYEVHWQTIGANDRLLDLGPEYEMTDMRLLTGLGLTKEIVAGEGTWGSTRINLEVMNTEYLFFRSIIQNYVEKHVFRPIALVNGFVEQNEFGDLEVLYPKLAFTRLSIRDNEAVFSDLFNLYQKGSLPIDYIMELYNIDPDDAHEKLVEDLFSVKDANFNELLRGIYMESGRRFAGEPDVLMKIAESINIKPSPLLLQPQPAGGGGGFGGGLMGDFGGGEFGSLGGEGFEGMPPEEGLGGELGGEFGPATGGPEAPAGGAPGGGAPPAPGGAETPAGPGPGGAPAP